MIVSSDPAMRSVDPDLSLTEKLVMFVTFRELINPPASMEIK